VATDKTKFRVFQVVSPKAEARKIEQYAKRKKISVSGFLRKVALLVIDANATALI